jgi:hypothetical protein
MARTWEAEGTPAEVALAAPYPSTFATTVGDFLITIPQLLEVLVPEDQPTGNSEGTLATQWLDKVGSCIADEITARVLGIQKLGAKVCGALLARSMRCVSSDCASVALYAAFVHRSAWALCLVCSLDL